MKKTGKKHLRFYKQLLSNFLLITILIFIPIFTMLYFNNQKLFSEIQEYEYQTKLDYVHRTQIMYDSMITTIDHASASIIDSKYADWFYRSQTVDFGHANMTGLFSMMAGVHSAMEYVEKIQLYSAKTQYLVDHTGKIISKETESSKFYPEAVEWFQLATNYPAGQSFTTIANNGRIWLVQRKNSGAESLGFVAFEVNLTSMVDFMAADDFSFNNKDFFVLIGYGEIMYCNHAEALYKNSAEALQYSRIILDAGEQEVTQTPVNNQNVLLTKKKSVRGNWIYAFFDHSDYASEIQNKVMRITILPIVIAIASGIISIVIISVLTYMPIQRILRMFINEKDLENRDAYTHPERYFNETSFIINSVTRMLTNSKDMEKELDARLRMLKKAQATALQTQTSPHFLYNTLDTIRWVSVDEAGKNNTTAQMLQELSCFYRKVFQTDNIIITLAEELEILQLYTRIINIRFGGRIQFYIDADENILSCKCLKMILQPVVENAINHGFRPKHYNGTIRVRAYAEETDVHIIVEDDGVGMTDSEIKSKNAELLNRDIIDGSRIGIANVNERIKLIYDEPYGVSLRKRKEAAQGLIVCITFPK